MPVAADVADWTFEEAAGTRLMEVADAVAGAGFAVNGNGIATTGDGHLLVRRGLRGAANYYAPLAAAVDGPVWLLAEVDGWHLLGDDDAGEELMIGLAGGSPRAWFRVADMRLRRSAADAVTLSAESDGLDASRGGAPVVLANPSRGPLSLALFHDPGARRFEGWLREGGEGEWRRFARGRTSPGRTAGAVRLRVVNRFNDADVEHLRLSRLRVTKEGPLPNPVVAERSGLLEAWAFDDPAGTGLAGLANTAGAAGFAGNGHGIATTGEGVLRLRRGRRGGALYHAAFESAPDESLWLVAQIDGWDLRGEPGEAVRFGFTNDADPRTWIDMRLERTEDGVVILEGRAGGPGASGIEARPLFANPQHGPLTLALNHDVTRQIYRIYHRAGDAGDWKLLGTGAADHTRHPTGVRLNVVNRFDDEDGERFDIASLRVTTTPPMADPDGLMETPFLTAWSWAAADAANGEILVAHEADVPRKSASITKAMTAMLLCEMAAENPELWEEVVDVSALAAATRGSSANLAEGDQVKVRDLVYGLMLPSGNDAGNAIAEHFHPRLAPPEDPSRLPNLPTRVNFLAEMNRRAAALGMESTFYRSAFGDGGTVDDRTTTAADLLRLGRHALTVEAFGDICGAAFYDGQVVHADGSVGMKRWRNSNQFLHGGDPFVTGIKTGTTGNAKACLLVSRATDDGRGLLMVVLGSDGSIRRYHDLRGLFAWLDAGRN
jgi:D-alanyl-D-alanine carboxypeptidase (penicillin-binding protein 5/6)